MGVPAWYNQIIAVVVATSYFIFIANVHSETLNYWKGIIMKGMSNAVRVFGYRVESLNNRIDNKSEVTLNKSTGRRIFIQSTISRKEIKNDDTK